MDEYPKEVQTSIREYKGKAPLVESSTKCSYL